MDISRGPIFRLVDTSKRLSRRVGHNSIRFAASVVLTALLTTTLAVPAFMYAGGSSGRGGSESLMANIRDLVRDPLAYLAQRSPGVRDSRDLLQLKHRVLATSPKGAKPHEQVLANVRYPSPIPDYINDILAPVHFAPFEGGSVPVIGGYGPIGGSPGVPSPVVPISDVPGSSPGGTTGGVTTVPEPATWLTLLLGMALVGAGVRVRQRRQADGATRVGFRARR